MACQILEYIRYRKKYNVTEEPKFCHRKELTVIERNILTQEEIYFHRKKFTVAGRNLLSQKEKYYYLMKFDVTGKDIGINFLELGRVSSKKNLLSQEGFLLAYVIFSFTICSFPVTGRKFLLQKGISCQESKFFL